MGGHLLVAQWLYHTFGTSIEEATNDCHWIFKSACKQGFLETAKWLNATFLFFTPPPQPTPGQSRGFTTTFAMQAYRLATNSGHEHVAAWLVRTFTVNFWLTI